MWAPKIERIEALQNETAYFVECVTDNKKPINDGEAGLRVVRMLEAADKSLKEKGKIVTL